MDPAQRFCERQLRVPRPGHQDPRQLAEVFVVANPKGFSIGSGPSVSGTPTVELASGQGGKVDIATSGAPLPLQVSGKAAAAQIFLRFSYPVSARPVIAPPGAKQLTKILAEIKPSA